MKSFKHFIQSLSEVFQGTRSECMKMCRKLGHSQEECEKRWCSKSNVSIQEDIELVSGHPRTTKSDMRNAQMDFKDDAEYRKNLGKIHKDYSLHHSDGHFFITHDASGKVIGHIETDGSGKKIKIGQLNIDKDHTKKKIGHSLAVAAYKHLHKTGYTIHSGEEQSVGGANVWRELMKDPETKDHIHAVHSRYGGRKKELGPASKMPTEDIWTSGSREARTAGRKKGIRMHDYYTPEAEHAQGVQLVLRPKVKK